MLTDVCVRSPATPLWPLALGVVLARPEHLLALNCAVQQHFPCDDVKEEEVRLGSYPYLGAAGGGGGGSCGSEIASSNSLLCGMCC